MNKPWPADAVERRSIDSLIPYAKNSRTHSDEQVAQISASMKEWGWTNPILIDETGSIIAGHGRVLAARKLGYTEAPVMVAEGWTQAQKAAYIIADNKLALNAGWDVDMLKLELGELESEGFALELTGFSADELKNLLIEETVGLTDEDAVPDVPETPVTVLGDVWIMGNHRLMCGDSTSIDAVDTLMAGQKVDMVFTDPPYGINEKGDRSKRGGNSKIVGNMKGLKLPDFKDDTIQYAIDAYGICEGMGIKRQVWWGANYYCHSLPQSNNWFIWDKRVEEKHTNTNSDCEMAWVKSEFSSVRIFRHLWNGICKASEHNQSRIHPTQKPVALAEWAFNYFKNVESVLDLFGGSGSTLIACEKTGRINRSMELDPKYCDVIVKRWQEFTGKQATLEATGENFPSINNEVAENAHKAAA